MAVLGKILVGACAIASFVEAAPFRVKTVTDLVTVTTWTTIELNATTTVWASSGETPAATTASDIEQTSAASVVPIQALATPALPSTTTAPYVAPQQPASTTTTTTTTTTTVAPVPTTSTTTTTTSQAPVPVTTQPPTTLQMYTTTTTPSQQPVAAAAAANTAAATSSSGGPCVGAGSACTGDVTHWDGGLGACGWNVDTASDMQIALPVGMMGSLSNSNPYCGKSLSIKNPISGAIIQATVGDKCMGCEGDSIDLTDILFNTVTSGTGNGRVSGVEWWFN